jgi:cytochrome c oxidase subunit 2
MIARTHSRTVSALIDTRSEFDSLADVYLLIAIAVAAIVFGAIGFALLRYRRRDGRAASRRESAPLAEGIYAVVLVAVVAVLATLTFRTEAKVDEVSTDPAQVVDVTAFQWGWRFTYPHTGVTIVGDDQRPPTLFVPAGETVRFDLTARDVIHAFWVPELRFKRDAIPDRTTSFDLVFSRGTIGRCAEFCGLAHAEMTFDVVAFPPAQFRDWLRSHEEAARAEGGG